MKKIKCPCCGKRVGADEENCPNCFFKLTPNTPEEEETLLRKALGGIFTPMSYFSADFAIIRRAAKAGNAEAQYRMGDVYLDGFENIPKSLRKAKAWYKKSAKAGYAPAAERLQMLKEK